MGRCEAGTEASVSFGLLLKSGRDHSKIAHIFVVLEKHPLRQKRRSGYERRARRVRRWERRRDVYKEAAVYGVYITAFVWRIRFLMEMYEGEVQPTWASKRLIPKSALVLTTDILTNRGIRHLLYHTIGSLQRPNIYIPKVICIIGHF